jgi:hypothetical protein
VKGLANRTIPARSCACGRPVSQPPRSPRAERAAEHAAALGVDVATVSLRDVTADRQLLDDLSWMDLAGMHRVCGWPRPGRKLDVGRWSA